MSDVQNPWEDGNNSETSASSMGNDGAAKVIHMRKPKIAQNVVNGGGFNFGWIIAVLILVWLATGIYQVQPNEQGVVLRFGKYTETTDAGLHYHIPYPIEEVYKVSMTQERSINLGEAAAYTWEIGFFCLGSCLVTGGQVVASLAFPVVCAVTAGWNSAPGCRNYLSKRQDGLSYSTLLR